MKFKTLFKRVYVISVVFLFSLFQSFEGRADEGKIGEIRYSILTEAQFREIYGEGWELMQGQVLDRDSDLFRLWGQERVPDARGLFLRGHNNGRTDAFANPDCSGLGHLQGDCFKKHDHGGGNHRHEVACELSASRNPQGGMGNTMAWYPPKHQTWHTACSGKIIADAGGNETRPKNITVNIFIKVRDTAPAAAEVRPAAPALQITPELMNQITSRPEFQQAVENTVREMMNRD